ncbi:MAG: hypothetical protein ACLQMO_08515 [Acidobacteriaceae bacterium]
MRLSIPLFLLLIGVCLLTFPARAQAPSKPSPVLVVVNQGDKNVSLVDPASEQQIATISEGVTASMAMKPPHLPMAAPPMSPSTAAPA